MFVHRLGHLTARKYAKISKAVRISLEFLESTVIIEHYNFRCFTLSFRLFEYVGKGDFPLWDSDIRGNIVGYIAFIGFSEGFHRHGHIPEHVLIHEEGACHRGSVLWLLRYCGLGRLPVHFPLSVDKPFYIQFGEGFHGVLHEIESRLVPAGDDVRYACRGDIDSCRKLSLCDVFRIQKLL